MTKNWLRCIWLIVPPLAWALSVQLGQVLPYADCHQNVSWTAAFCGLLLVVSIVGVAAARADSKGMGKSQRFVFELGFLTALPFVFALSLQEAAATLLDACQR